MRRWLREFWPLLAFGGFAIGLIGFAAWLVSWTIEGGREADRAQARLMKQCMDDGHKEYECVAMLRRSSGTTHVVPMPVVVNR
jgi:hypothetical protein